MILPVRKIRKRFVFCVLLLYHKVGVSAKATRQCVLSSGYRCSPILAADTLRYRKKECPACRAPLQSRRDATSDKKFDQLIKLIVPQEYETEQGAELEQAIRHAQKQQANMAEAMRKQQEIAKSHAHEHPRQHKRRKTSHQPASSPRKSSKRAQGGDNDAASDAEEVAPSPQPPQPPKGIQDISLAMPRHVPVVLDAVDPALALKRKHIFVLSSACVSLICEYLAKVTTRPASSFKLWVFGKEDREPLKGGVTLSDVIDEHYLCSRDTPTLRFASNCKPASQE
eukprot:TRINITY_DN3483_c0_g1_i2.p1 TRINITY_DN3483_c0_g1~~TRINITY_DN3483_c0_g1_i2.p1  ORF type:complete len:283 (-),score=60.64 TRINITY_DN3483_c0_g1_i2:15-863(-)